MMCLSSPIKTESVALSPPGSGYRGVAADIEAVLEACQDIGDLSFQPLTDVYHQLYALRISRVVDSHTVRSITSDETVMSGHTIKGLGFISQGDSEMQWWARVVNTLSNKEYIELSLDIKTRLLFSVCDELLSTAAAKGLLENSLDLRARVEREFKLRVEAHVMEVSCEEPDATQNVAFSRSGRRIAPTPKEEEILELKPLRKSKSPGKLLSDMMEDDEERVEEPLRIELCRPRQEPLGADREGNYYWMFFGDCVSVRPQLYCQRFGDKSSDWVIFSSLQDISLLQEWLNEKCRNEVYLKKHIAVWAADKTFNDMVAPVASQLSCGDSQAVESTTIMTEVMHEPINEMDMFRNRLHEMKAVVHMAGDNAQALCLKVNSDCCFKLGLSIGVFSGIVYVSHVSDTSERCLLEVGDLLLVVENSFVTHPSIVVDKLQEARAKRNSSKTFTALILRHRDPALSFYMRELFSCDDALSKNFAASVNKKSTDQNDPEQAKIPGGLIGGVLDLVLACSSSYSIYREWLACFRVWAVKICAASVELIALKSSNKAGYAENHKALVESLVGIMIEVEGGLVRRGTVLKPSWLDRLERKRYKWHVNCGRSRSFSHVSILLAGLLSHINWSLLLTLSESLSRPRWIDLVESNARVFSLPVVNELVIYYGDGHVEFNRVDNSPIWGCTIEPIEGAISVLKVIDAAYYGGGPTQSNSKCFPFMIVGLENAQVSLALDSRLEMKTLPPNGSPGVMLQRLLTRILALVMACPDFEPFISLVSNEDFPDYLSKICKPICLTDIHARLAVYTDTEAFLQDIQLLHSNCTEYCAELYPDVVLLADRLVAFTKEIIDSLRVDLDIAEKQSTCQVVTEEVKFESDDIGGVMEASGKSEESAVLTTGGSLCLRLHGFSPQYLVKKSRYDAGLELLGMVELESPVRTKVFSESSSSWRNVSIDYSVM
jgi:hypothetical protein